MNAETRRKHIIDILSRSTGPISAAALAGELSVSRQVIVGDIALLRAAGEEITATPRGYVLVQEEPGSLYTVACYHTEDRTEDELNIFVDNGCIVEDVVVEHPIYGQIVGQLHLVSRYDVGQFVARLGEFTGASLCSLTGGIHLHTLRCPDDAAYNRACEDLKAAGMFLMNSEE